MRKRRYIRPRGEKPRYINAEKTTKLTMLHGKAVPENPFEGARISYIDPKYIGTYITSRVKGAE